MLGLPHRGAGGNGCVCACVCVWWWRWWWCVCEGIQLVVEVSPLSLHTHRSDGQLGGPPILVSLQLFLHHSVVPPAGP